METLLLTSPSDENFARFKRLLGYKGKGGKNNANTFRISVQSLIFLSSVV
jgi:hypothetical protein